ncbi:MAG: toll/interleukin-1 receptor domain-containing protein [Ktedonobacterales bacterium]|jgi:hypothetical protein
MRESTPRIFVSHNHDDSSWCKAFVEALQAMGYDTWYYEGKLGPGDNFVPEIEQQIIARPVFMILVSSHGAQSNWVKKEMELAMYYQRRILPIVLEKVSTYGFINTYQHVDVIGCDPSAAAQKVIEEGLDPHYDPPVQRTDAGPREKWRLSPVRAEDPFKKFDTRS